MNERQMKVWLAALEGGSKRIWGPCDDCGSTAYELHDDDQHTWNGQYLCSECIGPIDEVED